MYFLKIFFISIFTFSLNIFGEKNYDLEVLVDGLDHPWSLVELSSGEFPVSYTHLTLPTNREV